MARKLNTPPAESLAPPSVRGLAKIEADIEAWRAEAAEAETEYGRTQGEREEALATAEIDEIVAFDTKLARCDARRDRAMARIAKLKIEYDMAKAEDAEAQTIATHAKAAALADRIAVLVKEKYVSAAAVVADVIQEIYDLREEFDALNDRLPAAMQMETEDRKYSQSRSIKHENAYGVVSYSYNTLYFTGRVCLPGIGGGEDIWPRN